MNVRMWIKALQVIPRITREEWGDLDIISRWLIATRAAVLIMTFLSAAIAGILAQLSGMFDWERFAMLALGLVFAHATNNLLNDYTDFSRGVDKDNYFRTQYGPQPLEQGLMTKKQLLIYAAVTGLIAILPGIYFVYQLGLPALGLMLAGSFFVLFYTWPLKFIGMGEIAVLFVWGPLMIGGGYYVITGIWDWNVVIASMPYALGVTTVIFGKHIDKIEEDKAKNIQTLPVIIGEKAARFSVIAMGVLQFLSVVYLVITGFFEPWVLIILLALFWEGQVLRVFSHPKPKECPSEYRSDVWPLWFVAAAFYHNRIFGMLFLGGLILGVVF